MSCHAAQTLDRHGAAAGPVQELHPLAKLLATAVFAVTVVSFPKYAVGALVPLGLYPLLLGVAGRVPVRPVWRLLRLGLPLAALAGIWNVWLDPVRIALPGGVGLSAGWFSFSSILLRYLLTAGAMLVLIGTTSFPRLVRALAGRRPAHPFLQVLYLLYRHLFVLVEEGRALARAWQLRSPQRRLPELRIAGSMLGGLFLRTETRAGRLHHAMVLRGYDGSLAFRAEPRWGWRESAFLGATVLGCLAARVLPLTEWLGRALLDLLGP